MQVANLDTGRWLEEALGERAAAADGIADAVMAQIEANGAAQGKVVHLQDARARRSRAPLRLPLVVGAVAGVLAVAAAAVLFVQAQSAPTTTTLGGPVAIVNTVAPPPPVPSAVPVPEPGPSASLTAVAEQAANEGLGVEVDEIDSPAHDVTVFEIPASGVAAAVGTAVPSSVVIMISDEPVKP
jgi:hypothetical protein